MPAAKSLCMHQFLYTNKTVENCLGPRRAAGHIHINRDNLVDALQYTVRIKIPPDEAQAPTANTSVAQPFEDTPGEAPVPFFAMVPITMRRSHCRGVKPMRSEPKRERS